MNDATETSLLRDPIFYITLVFFAVLTTLLPGSLGQRLLMPLAQTATLWLFALISWRRRSARYALYMIAIWVVVQAATFFGLTLFAPDAAEKALGEGFAYGEALLEWFYTGSALPRSWATAPWLRVIQTLGITIGAALTGGVLGVWFLVRLVSQWAFGFAVLIDSAGALAGFFGGMQPWFAAQIAGAVGLVAVLALPGYTGEWSPSRWSPGQRKVLWISLGVFVAGLLLELVLPGLWSSLFGQ